MRLDGVISLAGLLPGQYHIMNLLTDAARTEFLPSQETPFKLALTPYIRVVYMWHLDEEADKHLPQTGSSEAAKGDQSENRIVIC
jgi:hypothetical protein